MPLSPDHVATLKRISEFLSECVDPWWIIGSAAIALIEIDPGEVRDIDVLISPRDSARLMRAHQLEDQADGGTDRYRSDSVLRPELGNVPVEFLSNYFIKAKEQWIQLAPKTQTSVNLDGATVFVPDTKEQVEILLRLGRQKDLRRVELIQLAERR